MSIRVAITLGDPAGAGPKLVADALAALAKEDFVPIIVGPTGVLPEPASSFEHVCDDLFEGPIGRPSPESGAAALETLDAAIDLIDQGGADALVTAPISKEALAMAGCDAPGHTPLLARALGEGGPVAMAFLSERLQVVLATEHLPLRQIFDAITPERIVDVAGLLRRTLRDWRKLDEARLGVAALNPHAGEAGLLGDEEQRILAPAIELGQRHGITLCGPYPADSIFRRAFEGELDGVVALYHDQGLIPIKMLGLGQAVHVTLGLKVPRTSPDHGTAYDRVGTESLKPDGMIRAIKMAVELARTQR